MTNGQITAEKATPAKKTAAKPTAKKQKTAATKAVKKTVCPVCVNGRGEYANIAKHNKRHHGGKTPEVK